MFNTNGQALKQLGITQLSGLKLLPDHMCVRKHTEALQNVCATGLSSLKVKHHRRIADIVPILGGHITECVKLVLVPRAFKSEFGGNATLDSAWKDVDSLWENGMRDLGWRIKKYSGSARHRQVTLDTARSSYNYRSPQGREWKESPNFTTWYRRFDLCLVMEDQPIAAMFMARCVYACDLLTKGVGERLVDVPGFSHQAIEQVDDVKSAFSTYIENSPPHKRKTSRRDHRQVIVFGSTSGATLKSTGINAQFTLTHLLDEEARKTNNKELACATLKSVENARQDGANVATRLYAPWLRETVRLAGSGPDTVDQLMEPTTVPSPTAGDPIGEVCDDNGNVIGTVSHNATLSGSMHVDMSHAGLPVGHHPIVVVSLNISQTTQPSPRYGMFKFAGRDKLHPYRCVSGAPLPLNPSSRTTLSLPDVKPMCFTIILGEIFHASSPRLVSK